MHRLALIVLLIFGVSFESFATTLPDCCKTEYIPEPDETWQEIFQGGHEPRSLLASWVLGTKIGVTIVAPIVGPVTYLVKRDVRGTLSVTAFSALLGAPLFVEFFYVLGRALNYFGLYDGLEGKQKPSRIICYCPEEFQDVLERLSHRA